MSHTRYDIIGKDYDTTRSADPYLVERILAHLGVQQEAHVLDIGCGTGNYTVALHGSGLKLTGVDPSVRMLDEAREKSAEVEWLLGKADALPVPDAHFDGAVATLTTHHWKELGAGFKEVRRVLRPGAQLVLFTSSPEQMRHYWLGHYFPSMMERSCAMMPTPEATEAALTANGFIGVEREPYTVRPDLQDHFLYAAKDHPARYFDPAFRGGMSSFAALSNADEVAEGLDRLRADITSGAWDGIRAHAEHSGGDYLFLRATTALT